MLDKHMLIEQMARQLKASEAVAQRAEQDAREAARSLATESEKKEDGRVAIEYGSLAKGQAQRAQRVQDELRELAAFSKQGLPRLPRGGAVQLGAIVDVSLEGERGSEERTFFLLPVGAGTELHGPGGDGFLSVITPASPVGRALLGRRAGDCVEIMVKGEPRECTILEVG